jgi:sulfate/thiosulfate transport system ATP-binding protein
MSIQVRNVSKHFGQFHVLNNVSLEVFQSELLALLGPSGSGKTTLLRVIAGLEQPDSGSVVLNEHDATCQSPADRRVGFVFQHYALFGHMTVFENVAFGLRVRARQQRPSKSEIRDKVMELLRLVQLESQARHFPSQLSGGQRQRVALARALAVEPKVLLLDEPFGALDAKVRKELRRWLRRLHDEIHIASVFVTHDQEEALELADRVAVMNDGRIEQIGTPNDVYDQPANAFVYNFLGKVNLFHARIEDGVARVGGALFEAPSAAPTGASAFGYVRPHELEVTRSNTPERDAICAKVAYVHGLGPFVNLELTRTDTGETLHAQLSRKRFDSLAASVGDVVHVRPNSARVIVEENSI